MCPRGSLPRATSNHLFCETQIQRLTQADQDPKAHHFLTSRNIHRSWERRHIPISSMSLNLHPRCCRECFKTAKRLLVWQLVIHLKRAKALGLSVSPVLLSRFDE